MANIDDRVVSMSFEASKFQAGVAQAIAGLQKLNESLKNIGAANGLENIEKSANKVNFLGIGTAIDKLKAKFGKGFPEADQAFSDVEKGSGKVGFTPLSSAIDKIKGKFHFPEADQAFSEIERGSDKVTFTGLTKAIDSVQAKFSVLEGAAAVALGNVASKAAMAGGNMVKSLTINPVTDGLHEYETQLNAVQTILSNTAASGAKLKDVNKALNELNKYADKTIYNFTEMTKNIGTFTAAGVDLKTATQSIKGIANLAALSGSNSQQASTAMYQLSQAISAGRVSLQDWNSVVNAGMGGTLFQRALAQTAEHMGTLDKGAVKLTGSMKNVTISGQSFRESVQTKPGEKSWLTSDVLTTTLKQLSGDMTDAQLKAKGYSDAQIKAIQAQAKMAVNAATQVKTLSGLLDTVKEAIGSGWAQTWQLVFGDFGEAKTLFTGLSNAIGGFVSASSNARNAVLKDWKDLGGRKVLIEGLKDAFQALMSVIKPIKDAFREIFPRKTGQDLYDLTVKFRDFMAGLKLGPTTAENLKKTFAGFFAVLDIGKQVVFGVFRALGKVFGAAGEGSGGILALTGGFGNLVVSVDKFLKQGGRLNAFFDGLGTIIAIPVKIIGHLIGALGNLFGGNKGNAAEGLGKSFNSMTEAAKPAERAVNGLKAAWDSFMAAMAKISPALHKAISSIGDVFSNLGQTVADALKSNDFSNVFAVIQTGLVGGIFLAIKKALGGGMKVDLGGGLLKNISESLDVLQGSLKSIQANIKANTILQISAAVGVLAAAVVALSLVKPDRLASSMTAITVGFGQLFAAMTLLNKVAGSAGIVKMPVIAGSLILLAGAVDVLAIAVAGLSRLSWDELARGLAGVAGVLGAISLAAGPLASAGPGLTAASVGLIALGGALNLIALSVKIFSTMNWAELGRGLAGVAGALVAIGIAVRAVPPSVLLIGPGLIALGIGLTAIGAAVKVFGSMNLATLGKGLLGISAALVAIGLAMSLMPPTLPLTAAGLILVGIGLTGVAGAVALFGKMKWGTLVKGIAGLAASLVVLAAGLTAMVLALPGAAALLVASAALAIFVPVLGVLGTMKWSTIIKGLAALALSLGVIGVTGAVAAPALIALGVGLTALGVGMAAISGSVYILAKGLSLLGKDGTHGIAVLSAAMVAMVAILPKVILDFLKGLVQILDGIAKLAPEVVASVVKIANSMLDAVIQIAPKFAAATTAIIVAILKVLADNAGPIIAAGWKLLQQLLSGVADHIGEVIQTMINILVTFLGTLASNIGKIVAAGANLLAKFLEGVANNIGKVVSKAADVIAHFVEGVANNISKIISAGADLIIKFVEGIANNIGKVVSQGISILANLISGIAKNASKMASKGAELAGDFIDAVAHASLDLVDRGAKAVINFLNGIAGAIKKYEPEMIHAGANIGAAIVEGIVQGLVPDAILNKIGNIAKGAVGFFKKHLKINSPSLVFKELGGGITEGLALGVDRGAPELYDSFESMLGKIMEMPSMLTDIIDIQPTITPTLDLTEVKTGAKQLNALTNVTPITAAASYGQAVSISASQQAAAAAAPPPETGAPTVIKFEQNNYSPESLSETEIYRQTHNQLAQAKSSLGL